MLERTVWTSISAVNEACIPSDKRQRDLTGRAVSLFSKKYFSDPSLTLVVWFVYLFTKYEHDNVSVLFYRSGLPKVGQLWLLIPPSCFDRPGQLRESYYRNSQLFRQPFQGSRDIRYLLFPIICISPPPHEL